MIHGLPPPACDTALAGLLTRVTGIVAFRESLFTKGVMIGGEHAISGSIRLCFSQRPSCLSSNGKPTSTSFFWKSSAMDQRSVAMQHDNGTEHPC